MRLTCLPPALLLLALLSIASPAADDTNDAAQESEPILRINAGGHSATVMALAFTADSTRICSAGLDKMVQVWNLDAVTRDLQGAFLRERTIRWQVARGLRGCIYAMAASPSDDLLAFGGYGAWTSLGEILLVDIHGSLEKVLRFPQGREKEGHQQSIRSLAFSSDGNWLASIDTHGRAVLWDRSDDWSPKAIFDPDPPEIIKAVQSESLMRPIVFLGNRAVVAPVVAGRYSDNRLLWKLQEYDLASGARRQFDAPHRRVVTALAAAADGSPLASADLGGHVYLWDQAALQRGDEPDDLSPKALALSLSMSPDGAALAVGTSIGKSGSSEVQVWDVQTRRVTQRFAVDNHVQACQISPDGRRLAYTGAADNAVVVQGLDEADQADAVVLRGKARAVVKVAFAKRAPFYRVAFGTQFRDGGFNDFGPLEQSFDPEELSLDGRRPNPADWIDPARAAGDWSAKLDGPALQLFQGGQARGRVEFPSRWGEGAVRSYCWVADPDDERKPVAIAVGTDRQNSVYVLGLADEGVCPILRYFREHSDVVTSLGVSADRRYLVSGSADGTVKIWSLTHLQDRPGLFPRWGAGLVVVEKGKPPADGTRDLVLVVPDLEGLVVRSIDPAGPLYRKGLRRGDVIRRIVWFVDDPRASSGQRRRSSEDPAEILETLQQMPWNSQVAFYCQRDKQELAGFARVPAWQPAASLFVGTNSQWAFWTPEGYYDASINGHRLFGWQVNRGLERLPDFYRADQFRKRLERPDVMQRLLPEGNLPAAFRSAEIEPDLQPEQVLSQQIGAAPRVEILRPSFDVEVQGDTAQVAASIMVPQGSELTRTRVYANGVVSTERELVGRRSVEQGEEFTYQWDVALPSDERNLIQLIVQTNNEVTTTGQVVVRRLAPPPSEPARLFVLSVGIDDYSNPAIRRLDWSVADASAVMESLKSQAAGLYVIDVASMLTNDQVTAAAWKESLEAIKQKLAANVRPDDLLILFLAGHGVADPRTGEYYFVGHDFDPAELAAENPDWGDCISWRDFRILADVSCRKLAILDTCHSGAIQPPRSRDLKAAVRALQDDVIFTLTATTGEQKAAEITRLKHGVFTHVLLEGLAGRADEDGNGDQVVTFREIVKYIQDTVPRLAEEATGGAGVQTPTAAPDELLPFTELPLTRVENR